MNYKRLKMRIKALKAKSEESKIIKFLNRNYFNRKETLIDKFKDLMINFKI